MKGIWILGLTMITILTSPLLASDELPDPTHRKLPRYRGFNLLEKFYKGKDGNGPFKEADFKLISEWGFNFVRLPMDYRIWIKDGDWTQFNEQQLQDIDQAVEYGKKYNIHVSLNFHRAPGFTVAKPPELTDLWTDPETQRVCAMHWAMFAKRYKGIPNKYLSFNLVNEPAHVDPALYFNVAKQLIEAIRAEDPDRLIISDGLDYGKNPCMELIDWNVAQATRGYQPFHLTHYMAGWVPGSDSWQIPQWPPSEPEEEDSADDIKDIQWLESVYMKPWNALQERNIGVMVGEWGAYNKTPHDVTLRWMEDCLKMWKEDNIGWALWNFRGSFGVLNSGRDDVQYEDFRGHKLDRKMLELLLKY